MSGSSVVLDTNWAIGWLNGDERVGARVRQYNRFYLPLPVIGELQFGALNSQRVQENLRQVDELIARCTVLEVRLTTARAYAEVRFALRQKGRPLPENDVWIAALCIEHGLPLGSDDAHFQQVAGLPIVP